MARWNVNRLNSPVILDHRSSIRVKYILQTLTVPANVKSNLDVWDFIMEMYQTVQSGTNSDPSKYHTSGKIINGYRYSRNDDIRKDLQTKLFLRFILQLSGRFHLYVSFHMQLKKSFTSIFPLVVASRNAPPYYLCF